MLTIFIALLTTILVVDCVFLILLVLVQLPKKEAGIGMAFGGAATETLFGAGSGTVLTRATKYAAGIFMGLSLLLAIMNSSASRKESSIVDQELQRLSTSSGQPMMNAPVETSNAVTPALPLPTSTAPTQGGLSETLLLSNTNAVVPASAPETPVAPVTPAPQ